MKIATWNVNGIRARHGQLLEWVERDRPDVICLQEIKATIDQLPMGLCDLEGYWCYWHGAKGYSGVGLHVSKERWPERPAFAHPAFDFENRIVTVTIDDLTVASIYVPNGGKDFPAKMRFLESMRALAAQYRADGRTLILCGDLNVARTDMDVHPKERKPSAIGQLPRRARAARTDHRRRAGGPRPGSRAGGRRPLHLVGALAQHAPAKHRLAPRLRARQPRARGHRHRMPGAPRDRHQRPRARRGGVRRPLTVTSPLAAAGGGRRFTVRTVNG